MEKKSGRKSAEKNSSAKNNTISSGNNVKERKAEISRVTSETNITISINLDGTGKSEVDTGIGFFDHMLISFAKHGLFDLKVKVQGDLQVDCHHTI